VGPALSRSGWLKLHSPIKESRGVFNTDPGQYFGHISWGKAFSEWELNSPSKQLQRRYTDSQTIAGPALSRRPLKLKLPRKGITEAFVLEAIRGKPFPEKGGGG